MLYSDYEGEREIAAYLTRSVVANPEAGLCLAFGRAHSWNAPDYSQSWRGSSG